MYKLTIKDIKYSDKIVKPFEITDDIINSITLKSFKTLTKEQSITLNFVIAVTNFGRISYIVKENFDVEKYNMIRAEIVRDNENTDKKIINDKYLIDMLNRCEEFGVYFYKEA